MKTDYAAALDGAHLYSAFGGQASADTAEAVAEQARSLIDCRYPFRWRFFETETTGGGKFLRVSRPLFRVEKTVDGYAATPPGPEPTGTLGKQLLERFQPQMQAVEESIVLRAMEWYRSREDKNLSRTVAILVDGEIFDILNPDTPAPSVALKSRGGCDR